MTRSRIRLSRGPGWFAGACLLVTLGLLAGCAAPAPGGAAAPSRAPSAPTANPPSAAPPAATPMPAATAAAPLPMKLGYSVRTGSQAIAQVLLDSGTLAANGLAATVLYVEGPARMVPALLTGDVDVAFLGGEPTLSAAAEGAELAVIGGLVNRREHVVFAAPRLQTVADLRGQRLAINGINSADHNALLDALQHFGIDPQDVAFLVVGGGQPNRLAAIQAGAADATALQPPVTALARAEGLRELLQVGSVVERPVPTTAVVTSKSALAGRTEVLARFMRALRQGIRLYHEQPAVASAGIAAFFGLDLAEHGAEVEDTRAHYAGLYPDPPAPPVEGYRQMLADLAAANPRLSGFHVEDVIDERFVR